MHTRRSSWGLFFPFGGTTRGPQGKLDRIRPSLPLAVASIVAGFKRGLIGMGNPDVESRHNQGLECARSKDRGTTAAFAA
jgi:hypothetical protein